MTGPIMVAPVERDGIRYEALHWGKERNLGQNGGFVVAIDDDTGVELWVQKIYDITYGDKSPQKYDRFVTRLALIDNGAALAVTDDTGAVHRLDLTTRAVTLLQPAPATQTPVNPLKPAAEPGKGLLRRLFGD
jgi:outer membrane protein assembly factor BamB